MTTKKLFALAITLALAACSGRSGAEDAVRSVLKDPDSAKFGEFYYNSDTGKACLTTNAKNAMGGYTGDSQSHLVKGEGGWRYVSDAEETSADCRESYADGGVRKVDTRGMNGEQLEAEADRLEAIADGLEPLPNAVDDPSTMQ